MALVNVIHCCLDSIRQISEDIKDAVIYLDAGCTESFQLLGAFPLLLELGVHAICSLENMSPLDVVAGWNSQFDPAKKIVVITTRLLSDAHRYILRCLCTHQSVWRCAIYTSISEVAHSTYPDSPLGPDAFHEYETLLVQDYMELNKRSETKSGLSGDTELKENSIEEEGWAQLTPTEEEGWAQLTPTEENISNFGSISNAGDSSENAQIMHEESEGQKLVVSVLHFPMILCPFSPRVFVLPSEGTVAEAFLCSQHESSISPGLPPLSTKLDSDSEDIPPGASLTAQLLYHLAIKMDLKLETFSLGGLSKTIGKLLTDMSSLYDVGRRKRSAGLLLIDRTLDLLTPCSHGDSLADRIYSSLPRRQHNSSSQSKGSQSQLKDAPPKLRRDPLDVKIPLADILGEEDSNDNFGLLNNIEAFLQGWNSFKSDSQINELIDLSKKPQGVKSFSSDVELLSGSFVSTDNFNGTPYLEALLDRKTKDGTMLIKKWLLETLRKENVSGNVKVRPGLPSRVELRNMTKALAKSQSSLIRNKGIIQIAAAALHATEESHSAKWDAFASAEKILTVNAKDTSQSLAAQMSDLINKSSLLRSQGNKAGTSSQGLISFQDALLLTISGYMLAGENFPTSGSGGPFSWQEEHFLKEAIVDAVLENPEVGKLKFLHGLAEELEANIEKNKIKQTNEESSEQIDDFDDDQWGAWGDEDNNNKQEIYSDMQLKLDLRDRVDTLFKFLHKLSGLKTNVSSTLGSESNYSGDLYSSKGLLHKILTRVLSKYDTPGMEYHSSTVGRLFKSGFGRFGLGQAKPSLADQSVILVFIVGGISAVEVREAQEALSESGRPDIELMLGGTTLLTPNDMFELLLGESSYT